MTRRSWFRVPCHELASGLANALEVARNLERKHRHRVRDRARAWQHARCFLPAKERCDLAVPHEGERRIQSSEPPPPNERRRRIRRLRDEDVDRIEWEPALERYWRIPHDDLVADLRLRSDAEPRRGVLT